LEELLAELWQQCLGVPRVGIFDNFFELGGQSLMASQLVVRINERLGVEMPVETLFAAPRIAELAERIVELDSGEATDAYEAETSNA
jgi:acyl carrier protein